MWPQGLQHYRHIYKLVHCILLDSISSDSHSLKRHQTIAIQEKNKHGYTIKMHDAYGGTFNSAIEQHKIGSMSLHMHVSENNPF